MERPTVKCQLGGGVVHLPKLFGMKPYKGCEGKPPCILLCCCRLNVCSHAIFIRPLIHCTEYSFGKCYLSVGQ